MTHHEEAAEGVTLAERAVLGAMLIDPAAIPRAMRCLSPQAFHYRAHAKTFTAMAALHGRGIVPDLITLTSELSSQDELIACGGPGAIAGFYESATTSVNLEAHARIVRQAHAARERAKVGAALLDGASLEPKAARTLLERLDEIERAAEGVDSPADVWAAASLSGQKLADAQFPDTPSFLGDGVLPAGELAFLTGHSGVGKTFLAVQLISAISVGHTFCGLKTSKARVGLLELEMPWNSVQKRIKALHTIDLDSTAFLCSPPGAVHVTEAATRDNIAAFCKLHALDVLIVDPFNRLHDADENSGSDMGHVLEGLHELRRMTGVSMLVLHHIRKMPPGPAGQTSRAAALDAGRGSSRLTNDPATVLALDEARGMIRLTFAKVRHAESPAPIYLKRNSFGFFDVSDDPETAKLRRIDAVQQLLEKSGSDGLSSKLAADILKVTERTVRRDLESLGASVVIRGRNERVWIIANGEQGGLGL